jgi:hypothetical protein
MPLPKINHPVYEVYLKSLDRKVKFRPFLVKEEKLLLMAKEGEDVQEIVKTIKQIISNCLLEDIDVEKLPTFDVEMFFINLRIRSVSEAAEMVYTCNNQVYDPANKELTKLCGHKNEFLLDLSNVKYSEETDHNSIIRLNDKVGMKFNYPSLNFKDEQLIDSFEDGGYKFVSGYLDYIYDSEEIYKKEDIGEEELKEFFEELTMDQVKSIRKFFSTIPKVSMKQDITCSKCGHLHNLDVEGLLNFFD